MFVDVALRLLLFCAAAAAVVVGLVAAVEAC